MGFQIQGGKLVKASRIPLPHVIDAIYARLPKLECKRLCQDCCGPIFTSRAEWQRIKQKLGYEPRPTDDQAAKLSCPMLTDDGNCSVYQIRPMICRLWGLVETMRCPWGCVPERWVTDEESYALLNELRRL